MSSAECRRGLRLMIPSVKHRREDASLSGEMPIEFRLRYRRELFDRQPRVGSPGFQPVAHRPRCNFFRGVNCFTYLDPARPYLCRCACRLHVLAGHLRKCGPVPVLMGRVHCRMAYDRLPTKNIPGICCATLKAQTCTFQDQVCATEATVTSGKGPLRCRSRTPRPYPRWPC
jgi:hypothetical protein